MDAPELSVVLAQNGRFVRALARSLARDPERAEDLAQETWLRYVARPPHATGSLRHWFRTVVRNLASSGARVEGRRAERETETARAEALPSAAEQYEHAELLRAVVDAVLTLEEPYRSTMLARYWRGLSAVQVAEQTHTPLATVRSREQRALEQLRAKLDRDWKGEGGAWGLALARLLASEPAPAAPLATAPFAKLGLAAGVVLAGALTWRAFASGESSEPSLPVLAAPAVAAAPSPALPAARTVPTAPARVALAALTSEAAPGVGSEAFTAPPPSEVRVRFVFSDGSPAAGVVCTLKLGSFVIRNGAERREQAPPAWENQQATSGPDGRVSITFVKPVDYACRLEAVLPGHATVSWDWTDVAPGQVLELADAVMRLTGVITGRLVRPDGTPILGSGWSVQAQSIGHSTPDGRSDTSVTVDVDAVSGAFRIEGVMPGTNELSAYCSLCGWIQGGRVNVAEGGTASADIVHTGPDPARRIVVDVTMERYRTVAAPLAEHIRLLAPGQAPRTGRVFDDLAPGSYTLEIDDPRCVLWRQEGIQPGTRVEAELQGNSAVVLTVTDADGLPVVPEEVVVTLRGQNSLPNVFPVEGFEDGRLDGMFAGDRTIEVRAGGRVGSVDVDGLAEGETRAVTVVVAALPRVSGHARFGDGAPAAGLEASLLVPRASGDANTTQILEIGGNTSHPGAFRVEVAKVPVDEAGHFELVAPRAGTYLVRVAGFDGTEAFSASFSLPAGPGAPLELVLARPGSLSGRVQVPSGASTQGLSVWAFPLALGNDRSHTLSERNSVALDGEGRFTIPSVAAGSVKVFLRLPKPLQHRAGGWTSTGTSWMGERLLFARDLGTLEIPSGGAVEREFTVEDFPGSLELTVRVNGMPATWLALTLKGEDDGYDSLGVSTDEHGVYAGPLFPGTYNLTVKDDATEWEASVPAAIAITSGQPTILTVDLQRP
jgi:RNA polymerase sigma factor (sigma-70 family)